MSLKSYLLPDRKMVFLSSPIAKARRENVRFSVRPCLRATLEPTSHWIIHLTRSSSKGDLDLGRNNAGSGRLVDLTDGPSMQLMIQGVSAVPNGPHVHTWPRGVIVQYRRPVDTATHETSRSPGSSVTAGGRTLTSAHFIHVITNVPPLRVT
jgi:hypothetical protein